MNKPFSKNEKSKFKNRLSFIKEVPDIPDLEFRNNEKDLSLILDKTNTTTPSYRNCISKICPSTGISYAEIKVKNYNEKSEDCSTCGFSACFGSVGSVNDSKERLPENNFNNENINRINNQNNLENKRQSKLHEYFSSNKKAKEEEKESDRIKKGLLSGEGNSTMNKNLQDYYEKIKKKLNF